MRGRLTILAVPLALVACHADRSPESVEVGRDRAVLTVALEDLADSLPWGLQERDLPVDLHPEPLRGSATFVIETDLRGSDDAGETRWREVELLVADMERRCAEEAGSLHPELSSDLVRTRAFEPPRLLWSYPNVQTRAYPPGYSADGRRALVRCHLNSGHSYHGASATRLLERDGAS